MTIAWAGRCSNIVGDVRFYLQEENYKDTISDEMILRLLNRCLAEEIEYAGVIRTSDTIDLVASQEDYSYPSDYVSLIAASWAEDNMPMATFSDQGQFEAAKQYTTTGSQPFIILLRPNDFLLWPTPDSSASDAINWVYNKQAATLTGYEDLKGTITYYTRSAANTGIFSTSQGGTDVTVGPGQTNANVIVTSIATINGTDYEITAINAGDHKTVTLDGDPSSNTVSEIVSDRSTPPTLKTFDIVYSLFCLKEIFSRKTGKKNWDSLIAYYNGRFQKEKSKLLGNHQVGSVMGWYRL